jgi:hypothetical protein
MAGKSAFDSFIDSQKKAQAAQLAEIQTDGMAAGAKEKLRITMQGLAVAQANHIALSAQQKAALDGVALSAQNLALQLQGQQLLNSVTPIWQQYTQELNNNRAALAAVGATAEQVAASGEKTAEKFGLSWKQQVPGVAGSFAEIASAFGKEGSKMAAAAKILGAVQALISTYAGAAEALKLPFPANIAASAAVLAKGLALVATIKSAAVPKMATGGVFNIPGGIGGGDKVPVSFMAQPGEKVEVKPNRYGGAGSGSGDSTTVPVVLQGQDFSRDGLSRMFDGLNGLLRDRGVQFAVKPV